MSLHMFGHRKRKCHCKGANKGEFLIHKCSRIMCNMYLHNITFEYNSEFHFKYARNVTHMTWGDVVSLKNVKTKTEGKKWKQYKKERGRRSTESIRPTHKKKKKGEACLYYTCSLKLTGPQHYSLRYSNSLSFFEPTHTVALSIIKLEFELQTTTKYATTDPDYSPQSSVYSLERESGGGVEVDAGCFLFFKWVSVSQSWTSGKHVCTYSQGAAFQHQTPVKTAACNMYTMSSISPIIIGYNSAVQCQRREITWQSVFRYVHMVYAFLLNLILRNTCSCAAVEFLQSVSQLTNS